MGEAFALSHLLCHFLVLALMCSMLLFHWLGWIAASGPWRDRRVQAGRYRLFDLVYEISGKCIRTRFKFEGSTCIDYV